MAKIKSNLQCAAWWAYRHRAIFLSLLAVAILVWVGAHGHHVLAQAAPAPDPATPAEQDPGFAGKVGNFVADSLLGSVGQWIAQLWLRVNMTLVSIETVVLQLLIDVYIFAVTYTAYASEPFVTVGWGIMRDLVNAVFVILLLVVAVGTVLKIEAYGFKKLLPKIIIMILLVNFSFFFSREIIAVADSITGIFKHDLLSFGQTMYRFIASNESLIKAVSDPAGKEKLAQEKLWELVRLTMLMVLLVGWMVFVMFLVCIVVLVRIVALLFLLTFAPIGYLTSIIPATKKYADQWWQQLIGFAMYGPISAFLIWLTMVMMVRTGGFSELTGASANQIDYESLKNSNLDGGIVLRYFFLGVMMSSSLYMAKELSLFGVESAMNMAKSAVSTAAGYAMATGAGALKLGGKGLKGVGKGAFWGFKKWDTRMDKDGKMRGPNLTGKTEAFRQAWAERRKKKEEARVAAGLQSLSESRFKFLNQMGDKNAIQRLRDKRVAEAAKGYDYHTKQELGDAVYDENRSDVEKEAAARILASRGQGDELFNAAVRRFGGAVNMNRTELEKLLKGSTGADGVQLERLTEYIANGNAKEGNYSFLAPGAIAARLATANTRDIKGINFVTPTVAPDPTTGNPTTQRRFTAANAKALAGIRQVSTLPGARPGAGAQQTFNRDVFNSLRNTGTGTDSFHDMHAQLDGAFNLAGKHAGSTVTHAGQTWSYEEFKNLDEIAQAMR